MTHAIIVCVHLVFESCIFEDFLPGFIISHVTVLRLFWLIKHGIVFQRVFCNCLRTWIKQDMMQSSTNQNACIPLITRRIIPNAFSHYWDINNNWMSAWAVSLLLAEKFPIVEIPEVCIRKETCLFSLGKMCNISLVYIYHNCIVIACISWYL